MAARILRKKLPDTYFHLVRAFPLIHIRDAEHLADAQRVIDGLLQRKLDAGASEYLDALTDLVESYENEHEHFEDVSEADVLRELMRSHNLTQQLLAKATGIAQSSISAVLNGDRSLTKQQVIALAKYFGVSPAAFLPE